MTVVVVSAASVVVAPAAGVAASGVAAPAAGVAASGVAASGVAGPVDTSSAALPARTPGFPPCPCRER